MSTVQIAKSPNLSFLSASRAKGHIDPCSLPLILKKDGSFDWDANSYLTTFGGGPKVYNIKPLATTVEKKAYSLNLFCNFLEESNIELKNINDSILYQYTEHLKKRNTTDSTIIHHVRTALDYIVHLTKSHPDWNLSTPSESNRAGCNVHYEVKTYRSGRINKQYLSHRCLDGLIHIEVEAEYIHDDEYAMWIDAISCTSYHPAPNDFLISRWHALSTLLEITGSRISEVHKITRTMIKKAATSMMDISSKHVIRNIPINKGLYKGKHRHVRVSKEDLQVLLLHIKLIESKFPHMNHDAIFVDSNTGAQLKPSYLKNYAKKVINNSAYDQDLRHLSNHSFRHRFITLHVAKAIKKIARYGSFSNILSVAENACRKITMHASNATLSHYIHLAMDINDHKQLDPEEPNEISIQLRTRLSIMSRISKQVRSKEISKEEALDLILSTLDECHKYGLTNIGKT